MSVDLHSEAGGDLYFSNAGWRHLMAIAGSCGFRWPTYGAGDEVDRLTPMQARVLADVIEQALGDGTLDEAAARLSVRLTELLVVPSGSPMFSGEPIRVRRRDVEHWMRFVTFARLDGFAITY